METTGRASGCLQATSGADLNKVIVGMGCDRGTTLTTLEAAIDEALQHIDLDNADITGLATIDKKIDEQGLVQLAEKYGWPMWFYTAEQLTQVVVPNPSAMVMKYMGTPAVAEAAAMLAARTGVHDLLIEKYKYRGSDGKNATVSIVRLRNE